MAVVHLAKKTFKCKAGNCGKIYGTKQRLEVHQRSAGHGMKKLRCSHAKGASVFASFASLSTHMRAVHQSEKPFNCLEEECGKKFGSKLELENHLRSAHGAPKLVCKESNCAATFVFATQLYKHMKMLH